MTRLPVLVVGAGPVGLAVAVELSRRGLAVRIVDPGDGPVPDEPSRPLVILPATLAILAASGLSASLPSLGNRLVSACVARGGRRLARIEFRAAARDTAYPFLLSLEAGRMERAMAEWLAARGIGVERGVSITGLRDTHRPVALLSTGEVLAVDAVVGCDGARSWLRRELGIPFVGEDSPGRFAFVDVERAAAADASMLEIDLLPGEGAVASVPLDARRVRLIGVEGGAQGLQDRAEALGRILRHSDVSVAFRHAERMARGRVFLCGDAAHGPSPFGGRGMTLGIADAATLAFLLNTGRESEYEAMRLPVVRRAIARGRAATQRLAAPNAALLKALRWLAPAALALPGVQRRVARAVLALDLRPAPWL
ncbi:NAD(P)/FAD-dependent oxidoreductase [Aurantimonas sp. Leaf443]|uniref:FAD-dependent oxidoreductase n=1 Tax=Aurantimonas sp. Leaf443 TaxID=1736378 RepID=UPI0006F71B1C|nr:NAD(P)/FAD-dependent oxidoreductase [Aurantimonas sp. Leaf443]KQT86050.1 hypothetical protein ASG48_05560 [Aurantimonas sp. Leaf443]